jgi:hypothetical protein
MGRMSSLQPTRSGPGRARRRIFLLAESLESRRLLSVGAMHPGVAPIANVPALIGPAVASPLTNAGATASAVAPTLQVPIVIEVGQLTINFGTGASVTENLFIVDGFSSSGINIPTPAPVSGVSQAPTPVLPNPTSDGNASASPTATTSITPLTATILAGPAANRAPIIVIVMPQTLINLAPSTIPVTTQAILLTATLEEQPLQPPVLGQGFESGQTQGSLYPPENSLRELPRPAPVKLQEPATDYVEPYEAVPPENPAPAEPAQPAPPAVLPKDIREADPLESVVLDPVERTDRAEVPPLPIMTTASGTVTRDEYPTWSLSTLVGTAAIASGGYQLLLGGSNRFNQRWLPTRHSSRKSRAR